MDAIISERMIKVGNLLAALGRLWGARISHEWPSLSKSIILPSLIYKREAEVKRKE